MIKNLLIIMPVMVLALSLGCSSTSSQEIEGPPAVSVVSASGEGELHLLVGGMSLSVAISVEHAGEVTCQRHEVTFIGSKIIGYAPGSDAACGDETVDIDWAAMVGAAIKIALKLI